MPNLYAFKNHFLEVRLYLTRTLWAGFFMVALLLILIIRLALLQVHHHAHYKTLALKNQVRIVPITPTRGLVYDRAGRLLAENLPAFNLEITPNRTPDIQNTLKAIQAIIPLTDTEIEQFKKQLKYKRRTESIPIKFKLNEMEVARFSVEKHHLPGVDIEARLIRHYPLKEAFAHALGYVGPINEKEIEEIDLANYRGTYSIGKNGVEKFYETLLHGKTGYQHIETDAKGRTLRVLERIAPTAGSNLYLSLDSHLQAACYEALTDQKGAVVALDPRSGDVLALVSAPSFDPNFFAQGIDALTYKALHTSPDKPLFDRAIRGQYPPGSTLKPLATLQGLELGLITPQFTLFDPGWYQLNGTGRLYRDWIYFSRRHGHGTVDLNKAMSQSCDTYFFTLAHKMGIQPLSQIYSQFGIGKRTQIDLPGEAGGLAPTPEWKKRVYKEAWYPGDTLNVGIGQGFLLATPLQLAHVTALLANQGHGFEPRLVSSVQESPTQSPVLLPKKSVEPIVIKNPKHWEIVIQAMQKVVHLPGGTAYRISQGIQYQMAGKTGTAQVFNLKQNEKYEAHKVKAHLRDHSWFIAFAPIEKPEIAIAVLVENKKNKTGADVARVILDHYFHSKPQAHPVLSTDEDETHVGGEDPTD